MEEDGRAPEPRVIDGYKRDTRGKLVVAMLPGVLCAIVGALLLLAGTRALVLRDPAARYAARPTAQLLRDAEPAPAPPLERGLLYVGTLLCLASPIVMGLSLRRLLDSDDFLLLRLDGLVHQSGGRALLFPWDEVREVRYDEAADAVVLVMDDESEFRITDRYAGARTQELARHVADFRRKTLWNLLPSQQRRRRI